MFDTFLKIDGVPGESTDDKHKDWIEVLSFSLGHSQGSSSTASSTGGGTTERADFHDVEMVKQIDTASAKIVEYCVSGKHIPNVVIECCRAGGDKVKYYEIKMEQVIISEHHIGGHGKGDDPFPTESVSFNFGKIKWGYTQQKR